MVTGTTSRRAGLQGLRLVNPHAEGAWVHGDVAASRPIPLASATRPLAVSIPGAGRERDLPTWNAETHGTSLVVVDGGTLVHEWYVDGLGPDDLFLGASMTKSVLAHLVGLAVRAGSLSVADRVVDHVPELAAGGYADCTVEHLLTMTTGVDWVEDHRDPHSRASGLVDCFGAASGGSRDLLVEVRGRHTPGTRFEYCTADSQVLDWVRERANGTSYVDGLRLLWAALGCEADAVVALDAPDGVPLAGGGLAATARDWARVAMLQSDGTVDGRAVLDPGWVEAASVPSRPFLAPGRLPSAITTHAGFGYHWWPLDDAGRRVTADGSRGQFAFVDRDHGVVVVKTSRWPYDDWLADRQSRDLSYLGLPLIAQAAVSQRNPLEV